MSIDFMHDETTYIPEGRMLTDSFPTSQDVAGIELRMLPPFIRDNRTLRIWPFPGYAHLYCLTMVVSDVANQLTGFMDLNAFPRIGKQEFLPLNKTIFYWEESESASQAPTQLHVMCPLLKARKHCAKQALY